MAKKPREASRSERTRTPKPVQTSTSPAPRRAEMPVEEKPEIERRIKPWTTDGRKWVCETIIDGQVAERESFSSEEEARAAAQK